MWTDTERWMKTGKTFLSHINFHQRASTNEETLSSQVDKMTRLDDASQPLLLVTPQMGAVHGPNIMGTQLTISCYCYQMSNLLLTETNAGHPIWHHSLRNPTDHLMASWLHGATSILKRPVIHPHTRNLFLVWVCLSHLQGISQYSLQCISSIDMGSHIRLCQIR